MIIKQQILKTMITMKNIRELIVITMPQIVINITITAMEAAKLMITHSKITMITMELGMIKVVMVGITNLQQLPIML
jgi:hypothetical protein